MTDLLCAGRPTEWWWTGDPGNRLAVTICRRCTGCPDDDPDPHGVIRRGVAYSDTGAVLPECSICGTPNAGFTGGPAEANRCATCIPRNVQIPDVRAVRHGHIRALAVRGFTDGEISAETGAKPSTVAAVRLQAGIGKNSETTPQRKEGS